MIKLHSSLWFDVEAGDVIGVHSSATGIPIPVYYEDSRDPQTVLENGTLISHSDLSPIINLGLFDSDLYIGHVTSAAPFPTATRLPSLVAVIEDACGLFHFYLIITLFLDCCISLEQSLLPLKTQLTLVYITDAPEVFQGSPPCSSAATSTPVPGSEMIAEDWDPVVLIDGNITSCLHFPFLHYQRLYIKIELHQLHIKHTCYTKTCIIKLKGLQSDVGCLPLQTSLTTDNMGTCVNMSSAYHNESAAVSCIFRCHFVPSDTYLYLYIGETAKKICEIIIPS